MRVNRYLGVACELPTLTRCLPNMYMECETYELERYAFGDEIVYVTLDGSELCQPCAMEQLDNNMTIWETATGYDVRDHSTFFPNASETIGGYYTMGNTDSCAYCDNCNQYVWSWNCEIGTDAVHHAPCSYAENAP